VRSFIIIIIIFGLFDCILCSG